MAAAESKATAIPTLWGSCLRHADWTQLQFSVNVQHYFRQGLGRVHGGRAMRLLISQGELGVMYPGNAATVTEMVTYGACPCVILGIRKGTTAILSHIHKANSLAALKDQLSQILADALPADGAAKAFLATETYTGGRVGEAATQRGILERLKVILTQLGVTLTSEKTAHSAAIVTSAKSSLGSDGGVVSKLNHAENQSFLQWAMAYDKRFGASVDQVPMAIRVGVNAETPEQAMIRMYKE